MHDRLSFYVHRDSFLHHLNPLTKLTLAFGFILVAFGSSFYWTPLLLIFFGIIPLSFIGKVAPEYFNTAVRIILPAAGFLFIMQALFQPIGDKELFHIWFLSPTVGSVMFAFRNTTRIIVMVSSFTILLLTTHPSELMSDLTRRGLPSQFAYLIISTLQILPQMQAKVQSIIAAQRSRGLDTESSFLKRAGSLVPLVRPLIFGSLVEVEERAIAIEARGFTSTRPKTILNDIPDTTTDKIIRWILVTLFIFLLALNIWQ
jgi:energy-coupling factor transport system permease protein